MSVITGINVGKTNIISSYTDAIEKSDSNEFEVTAVELSFISSPGNSIYTGIAQMPSPIVKAIVNGEEKILTSGDDYELSYDSNINVGTANVTATGKGNYTGTVSSTWEILNADMTVTAPDQAYVYNGSNQGDDLLSVSLFGENEVIKKYEFVVGDYDSTYVPTTFSLDTYPQITNVSDSGTVYCQVSADNHNTVVKYYRLDIRPKSATLTWGDITWRYNGETHSTTCSVENLVDSDICTVNLLDNSITSIGTITVTAVSLSNSNYKLDSQETRTLTVLGAFFVKIDDDWKSVKRVYKKVSGSWVLTTIDDLYTSANPFSTDGRYVQKSQGNGLNIENVDLNMNLD